ncbi:hypothetical protein M153_2800008434 [Pseudoloma neurophilia]|uniref:Uncharacterized protein n=1 Tax=Pseudoloma neurophilia TaxID=146866 RepID=A0A0R0LYW6_9MICR|nr:hypothetical protein M153_2800008434 [Pseudoloma neurophilia]
MCMCCDKILRKNVCLYCDKILRKTCPYVVSEYRPTSDNSQINDLDIFIC